MTFQNCPNYIPVRRRRLSGRRRNTGWNEVASCRRGVSALSRRGIQICTVASTALGTVALYKCRLVCMLMKCFRIVRKTIAPYLNS